MIAMFISDLKQARQREWRWREGGVASGEEVHGWHCLVAQREGSLACLASAGGRAPPCQGCRSHVHAPAARAPAPSHPAAYTHTHTAPPSPHRLATQRWLRGTARPRTRTARSTLP